MENFKKGFAPIMLIVILAALALAGGGYWWWNKQERISSPVINQQQTQISWESLRPTLLPLLASSSLSNFGWGNNPEAKIYKTADITGDNIPEALVYIADENGSVLGSAHSPYFTLLRIENGHPALGLIKTKDGKIESPGFVDGGGGAGQYRENVIMSTSTQSISDGGYTAYDQKTAGCKMETYKWNPNDKLFEYNSTLSAQYTQDYCKDKTWDVIQKEIQNSISPSTANWKTYRNDKYGFEVKYPNGWNLLEKGDGMFSTKIESNTQTKVAISVDSTNKKNIDDWASLYFKNTITKTTLNGYSAVVTSDTKPNQFFECGAREIALISQGFLFHIFTEGCEKEMVDSILATFKFTK